MNKDIKSTKKCDFTILLIGVVIVCLIIGYLVGAMLFPQQTGPSLNKEQIIQETKEAIRDRLIEGRIINPEPEEIFALGGTVKEVGENYLVVIPSIKNDPLGDIFPNAIKILINEHTEFRKWDLKDKDEFEKEMHEYQKFPNKTGEDIPNQYIIKNSQLNSIELDNYILLTESESNIKGEKEFLAKRIEFSEQELYIYK